MMQPSNTLLGRALRTRLSGWLLIAALLVLWEISARHGWIARGILPPFSQVVTSWKGEFVEGTLGVQLAITLGHMAGGYVIGCSVGLLAGIAFGSSQRLWVLFEPIVEIARPVPITAIIPLMILFLGIDNGLKISVIAIATFFPVFMNSFAGVRSVSRTMRDTGRTFGLGPFQTTWLITIPAAAPMVFVGLRYAVSIGLVVALVSEMIAGNDGMGYFVIRAQQNLSVVQLFVGVFTLAALGYGLNFAFLKAEAAILPWQVGSARRHG